MEGVLDVFLDENTENFESCTVLAHNENISLISILCCNQNHFYYKCEDKLSLRQVHSPVITFAILMAERGCMNSFGNFCCI